MGRTGRAVATALALAAAIGSCGCSFLIPSRADVVREEVAPALGSSDLVQEGVLTVAFDTASAPEGITDADGTVTGYYADVAAALAQRLGLKVSYVDATSSSQVLESGQADIYLGASTSDEDESIAVFGDCLEDSSALFAKTDEGQTLSVDDLASMTVGVQGSSAAQDSLNKAGVVGQQSTYMNVNECFEALSSGEVDCVACDATSGGYLARAYEGVSFAGTLDAVNVLGIAASEGSSTLIDEVNGALEDMADDGTLDAIHATWFGTLPVSLSDHMLTGITVESTGPDDATGDGGDTGIMLLDGIDINELGA